MTKKVFWGVLRSIVFSFLFETAKYISTRITATTCSHKPTLIRKISVTDLKQCGLPKCLSMFIFVSVFT